MNKGTWFHGLTLLQAKLKDFLHEGRSKFGMECGYAFDFATGPRAKLRCLSMGRIVFGEHCSVESPISRRGEPWKPGGAFLVFIDDLRT